MEKRLLVTGGSGFIGTEVIRKAKQSGFLVTNLDIKPPRDDVHKEFWRDISILDFNSVAEQVSIFSPTHIVHLASDVDISLTRVSDFATIVDGTRNVVSAAGFSKNLERFVHISTQFVVKPGVVPIDERHLDPYTVYGESKAVAEKIIWDTNLPFDWLILRPTIIWGPYHPSFSKEIFRHIASRHYLHPSSSKPIMRSFGFVENTAEQIVVFLQSSRRLINRHVYYLGDETINYDIWADAFSISLTGLRARRVPASALKIMGYVGEVAKMAGIRSPLDAGRAFRMTTSSAIDLGETHNIVGAPRISFDAGVKKTVDWLRTL